jgi:ubiquinone/menaquinone biosynthesis C-methylase UbiE
VSDPGLRFWRIAERGLFIQNPLARRHVRALGRRAGLQPDSTVLDLACGMGGPAVILAETFGCHVVGLERSPAFVRVARRRFERRGLTDRLRAVEADARQMEVDSDVPFDLGLCMGAAFVKGGLSRTVEWLARYVRPGGFVAVGECFLRPGAPSAARQQPDQWTDLAGTVERFEAAGVHLHAMHGATQDDWDRYLSTIWSNVMRYVAQHPDDPDAAYFADRVRRGQEAYFSWERDYLGWALLLGRAEGMNP